MKERVSTSPHSHVYMPAIPITRATMKHSWSKLPVTIKSAPETVCGEARRVGYTGTQPHDLALYRLKIKMGNGIPTITLPSFYILDDGVFQDYEHWQREEEDDSQINT